MSEMSRLAPEPKSTICAAGPETSAIHPRAFDLNPQVREGVREMSSAHRSMASLAIHAVPTMGVRWTPEMKGGRERKRSCKRLAARDDADLTRGAEGRQTELGYSPEASSP
jgi:hypothetical protein